MSQPLAAVSVAPGTDLAAIAADLADDGVAVPPGTDPGPLLATVSAARAEDGLELSVVVLDGDLTAAEAAEIAEVLRGDGTVLVITLDGVGAASATYPDRELGAAVEAAVRQPDEAAVAATFADDLTDAGLPWLLVIGVLVVCTAAAALLVRLRDRRGRVARDREALHAEGERVRSEIAALAPRVVAYEPRIALSSDPGLDADFDRLSIDYAALGETARPDPADRAAVDALRTRLADVSARLDDVGTRLDSAQ